jgi:hypothetical protein
MKKGITLLIILSLITPILALEDPFTQLPEDIKPTEIGWNGNYSQYYFGEDWITKNLKSDGAYISGISVDTKKALATSIFLSISTIHNNNPDDLKKADKILKFLIQQKNKQGLYYYYKDEGEYKGIIPADESLEKLYIYALAWDVMAHNYLEKMGLEKSQYIATINNKENDYFLLFNTSEIIQIPQNISQNTANQVLSTQSLPNNMLDITSIINYAENVLNQITNTDYTSPTTTITNQTTNTTNITIYYFTKNNIINEYKKELDNQKNQPYLIPIIYKLNNLQNKSLQDTNAGKFLSFFETNITGGSLTYYPKDTTALFQNPQYIALSPYYNMEFFGTDEDEIEYLVYKIYKINNNNQLTTIQPKTGDITDIHKYYTYYSTHADINNYLSTLYPNEKWEINKLKEWDKTDLPILLAVSSFHKDLALTLQNNEQKISNFKISTPPIGEPDILLKWDYYYTQKMLDNALYFQLPDEVFVIGKKPKSLFKHYTIYGYDTIVIQNNNKLYTFKTIHVKTSEVISATYTVNIYGLKNGTVYLTKANNESEVKTFTSTGFTPATIQLNTPPNSIDKITIDGYDWGGVHIIKQVNIIKTNDGHYSIKPISLENIAKNNTGSVISYLLTYHPDVIYNLDETKLKIYLNDLNSPITINNIETFLTKELEQEYLSQHKQIITQLLKQKWDIINGTLSIPKELDEKENNLYLTINHLKQLNKWKLSNNINQYHQKYINLKNNPTLENFENYVKTFEKRDLKDLWHDFWTIRDNIILKQKIKTTTQTGNLTIITIPQYANDETLIITAETINNYTLAKTNREKAYIGQKLLTLIPTNTTLAKKVQEEGINSYLIELNSKEFRLTSQFIQNNKNWNDTINKKGITQILFIENEFQNLNKTYTKPELKQDFQLINNTPNNTTLITIATKVKSYELKTWSNNIINQYNKHIEYLKKLEEQKRIEEQKTKEKQKMTLLIIGILLITILGTGIIIYAYKKSKSTYTVIDFNNTTGILRIKILKPTKTVRVKIPQGWTSERMVGDYTVIESDYKPGDIIPIRLKKLEETTKPQFTLPTTNENNNPNTNEDDDDDFDLPIEK